MPISERQYGAVTEGVCSRASLLGVKSWLSFFLSVSPWATHLILYYLRFLICKMELVTVAPTARTVARIKYVTVAKAPGRVSGP